VKNSAMRISVILVIGALLCAAVLFAPAFIAEKEEKPVAPETLNVGGSSVVCFAMDRWKNIYNKEKGIDLIYSSSGSAGGIKHAINRTYHIGFSSAPLTEDERKRAETKGGPMVQIPVVLVAVAPVYNVKELNGKPPLKFTGDVLADIFLGKIKTWNDPALKKLNEDVKLPEGKSLADCLPDKKITVVHRKDPSGTTFLFTQYLTGTSESWRKSIGKEATSEVKWPIGQAIQRNYGVAQHVATHDGTIGYVETQHALTYKISMGAVQNFDKSAFVLANPEHVTAAAKNVNGEALDRGKFSLTNQPGKDAYPICGVEWAVCYQNQPAEQKSVAQFLHWAVHDGQKFTADLGYAQLPEDMVHYADKKIKSIK
jgi:phosphate ABC transporter phosphate-binding protein